MLYDLADGPPKPGSLLESVFMVLSKRRTDIRFLETRVLAEAILAPHLKGDQNTLADAMKAYMNALLPYLAHMKDSGLVDQKKALEHWVNSGPKRVKPLWMAKERTNYKSRMRDAMERLKLRNTVKGKKI